MGFYDLLTFGDLQEAVRIAAPLFLRDTFSNFLFWLRLFGILVSLILFVLILFVKIKSKKIKVKKNINVGLSGIEKQSLLYDVKVKAMMKKVEEYISFENILYWKLALAEIDSYFNNVIAEIGFKGGDMIDRLNNIPEEYLSNLEDIKNTHNTISEILDDNNYLLTKEETEKLINTYMQGIEELKKL
jgi:hypothetical protein